MRVLLKISYDGTNYNGWQSGKTGIDIEGIISNKISEILDEEIKIFGTSRTDAGVHALSNYAIFDTKRKINVRKFYFPLNNILPKDIVIVNSMKINDDFNPRKEVLKKTYDYYIYHDLIKNVFYDRFSYFVRYNIDIDKMIEASKFLIGEHDFKSFTNPKSENIKNNLSTIRNIYEIEIKYINKNLINIHIVGNSFLYNMVRIICGSLLKVGMNMWESDYIEFILNKKNRRYAGLTLPARGLVLSKIDFFDKWHIT